MRTAATLRANATWEREQSGDYNRSTFAREIGPNLQAVSLAAMMRETGHCMLLDASIPPHARATM